MPKKRGRVSKAVSSANDDSPSKAVDAHKTANESPMLSERPQYGAKNLKEPGNVVGDEPTGDMEERGGSEADNSDQESLASGADDEDEEVVNDKEETESDSEINSGFDAGEDANEDKVIGESKLENGAGSDGAEVEESRFANLRGIGENTGSDDDDDDESKMEVLALSELRSQTIVESRNDEAALERKLAEVSLFTPIGTQDALLPFQESLRLILPMEKAFPDKLAIDDLEREKQIAAVTTAAVHNGLNKLRSLKVRFRRPSDYFAQMVKTDEHMGKVKSQILREKEKIEAAQKRRNNRDIKKNKKKVRQEQFEKEQEKKRKTKQEIEAVNQIRQERLLQRAQDDNKDDEDEFPIEMLDVEQLDKDRTFQKHSDIASGKRKAWKPPSSDGERRVEKRGRPTGSATGGRKGFRNNRGFGERDGKGKRQHSFKPDGSIRKKGNGGKKKRLGKSRRLAKKSKQ